MSTVLFLLSILVPPALAATAVYIAVTRKASEAPTLFAIYALVIALGLSSITLLR